MKNFNLLLDGVRCRTVQSMKPDRDSLEALKNMLEQVELLISTTEPLPENPDATVSELLRAALALTDDLLGGTMGRA